jgi:hypothetical protein
VNRRVLLLAGAVIVFAAAAAYYLFGTGPEREFTDVRAVVAALQAEGISCEDLNVSAPDPTPDIVDFGSCQMDGKTVNLHVYRNAEALERHIEGNVAAREIDNPNYFTSLVAGDTWVIDTYSDETSRRIQEALGGEIH